MPAKPAFSIAVMINPASKENCWHYATDFLLSALADNSIRILGVFATGRAVHDALDNKLDKTIRQKLQKIHQQGLEVNVCRSRLPDGAEKKLSKPLKPGSLGQWMEWLESADLAIEWT